MPSFYDILFSTIPALLLGIYFKHIFDNYLGSYFKEKGKNLATTEDIGEITKLVEDVKITFTKETEKLKANLNLLSSVQIGLMSEERQSIIDFHLTYDKWFSILTDTSVNNIDFHNTTELEIYKKLPNQYYYDFLSKETKLKLFLNNKDIEIKCGELKIATLKHLTSPLSTFLLNLISLSKDAERIKRTYAQERQPAPLAEIDQQMHELLKTYSTDMMKGLRIVVPLVNELQVLSKTYMYKLLNQ